MTLDPEAARAIDDLTTGGRPLLVVDVDEVIVHFVGPLAHWLETEGYRLDLVSYGLTGNIKYAGTERAVAKEAVATLLQGFFDARIAHLPVVDHATGVLGRLGSRADVILLTNAPHRHREARRDSLKRQGIDWPLITNDGPKGPAVAALAARASGPVVFIDDSPNNLASVRDRVPAAHLVHFIAHAPLLPLAPDVTGAKIKTADWREVERLIDGWL